MAVVLQRSRQARRDQVLLVDEELKAATGVVSAGI
jgi:hypothetical protein